MRGSRARHPPCRSVADAATCSLTPCAPAGDAHATTDESLVCCWHACLQLSACFMLCFCLDQVQHMQVMWIMIHDVVMSTVCLQVVTLASFHARHVYGEVQLPASSSVLTDTSLPVPLARPAGPLTMLGPRDGNLWLLTAQGGWHGCPACALCGSACAVRLHVLCAFMCCAPSCAVRLHVLCAFMCCAPSCAVRLHVLCAFMCCAPSCAVRLHVPCAFMCTLHPHIGMRWHHKHCRP